jgi:superfamily II DNA or RNA helicase
MDTVQRFGAKYRIGVSGTPDLQGMMPIMAASLGEVFHTTGKAELRASGILVTPSVQIVPTGFQRSFWPTHKPKIIYRCTNGHESDEIGNGVCECDAPMVEDRRVCKWRQAGCQGTGKIHRNNYHKVIDAVIKDPDRNGLIAELITDRVQLGGCVLVLSSRLEHLAVLRDLSIYLGVPDADAIMFTGEQTGEERMGIARRADDGYCALFSTIADEALDIPRLDTLVLAYPGRNLEKYKQKIGRIERDHPKKLSPLVIDFDDDVNVFGGQLRDRRQLYASEGLNVQVLEGTGV